MRCTFFEEMHFFLINKDLSSLQKKKKKLHEFFNTQCFRDFSSLKV